MTTTTQATVLIVDDDLCTTETFARMLRLEGFQARTATSAEDGLAAAAALARVDAIILDFRMPLMDGLGFLHRLRSTARHETTPVAIVTGDYVLGTAIEEELTRLGAQLHFKPLWLEDLVAVAHALVAGERQTNLPANSQPPTSPQIKRP